MDSENNVSLNRKLALKLLWIVAGAVLFVVAAVPFYNILCRVTGLNGKAEAGPSVADSALEVDMARWVTVQFTGNVMPGLAWDFSPRQQSMRVHPGQIEMATYFARNITDQPVAGQAVPSVTPGQAALYFKKIECFCFRRQALKAGEVKEMPLRFYISPELPRQIHTITLSYAFYRIGEQP